MASDRATLFEVAVWQPALEKFGAVARLTVSLYAADGQLAMAPVPETPLFQLFAAHGFDPGIVGECARACLAQTTARPAVIVSPEHGLAAVGTSIMFEDRTIGAAVAGFALLDFCERVAIERLARRAGVPLRELWEIARQQQPVPSRRMVMHGELLQVLCDTVARETARTRQYEAAAAELSAMSTAKDEFLAVLSHELRTPLTPILGWARMIKGGLEPAKLARAADVIERNARLQLTLVDDLLELNRSMRGSVVLELKVHNLGDLVRQALESVADAAMAKQIALRCLDDTEPLGVRVDENRLQQVFRNLLSNSLKFTERGGSVTVTLSRDGDVAVVDVADTGEGIEPEFIPVAFEMFRQQESGTRRRHAGLGIGLALVKRLMDAHGGTAAIASGGVGLGTVVTLRLPLADAPAYTEPSLPSQLSNVHALHGLRILVVEDGDDARDAIAAMLTQLGAEVAEASDGVDALDQLEAQSVDVVLCDLRMPRMDGFEFLLALRQLAIGAQPPVIAVSGLASSADHRRTRAAGFEDHIDKPYNENRVLAAVHAALRR
jgi:signal transduction histidine kinase